MLIVWTVFLLGVALQSAAKPPPNILLVVTDDQDSTLHGMFPLKQVQRLIGEAGTTFANAFTTSPLCCPSRASILSGLYAHNHHTYNNSVNGGCNGNHWRTIEAHSLPVLLQRAGYSTFFAGKYLNEYKGAHVPVGWSDFHGLHGNSRYYNYTLRENDRNATYAHGEYLTDHLRNLTLEFVQNHTGNAAEQPFFAMVCPPAPHQPFTPAERHLDIFAGIKALRTPNFNMRSEGLEKHWLVANSQLITPKTIELVDSYFQRRWETLLAVDELVADVIQRLEKLNQLDNTYVVYTSDNGYHMGQFAQPYDKRQLYETDIRVPLLVRGPNILPGLSVSSPVALIDLFPTMLDWAQLPEDNNVDGESFKQLAENVSSEQIHRSILIEYWGEGNDKTYNPECPARREDNLAGCTLETDCHCQDTRNNTYACVRHFRDSIDRIYCEFKDEEQFVEAYDLVDDAYQMSNIGYELLPIERAFYSLALANLTKCAGASCKDINI